MFTIFDFEKYVNENQKELHQCFIDCEEVPFFMKQLGGELKPYGMLDVG